MKDLLIRIAFQILLHAKKSCVIQHICARVWKRSTTYIVCSQLKVYYIRGGWHSAVNRGSCPLNRRRGIGQER